MKTKLFIFALTTLLFSACSHNDGGGAAATAPVSESIAITDDQGFCTERFMAKYYDTKGALKSWYDIDTEEYHGHATMHCTEFQHVVGETCTLNCSVQGRYIQLYCQQNYSGLTFERTAVVDECKRVSHRHYAEEEESHERN